MPFERDDNRGRDKNNFPGSDNAYAGNLEVIYTEELAARPLKDGAKIGKERNSMVNILTAILFPQAYKIGYASVNNRNGIDPH
jgi:hypothetical protein|tara:strand:+ start:1627 stop:1875 length:249 start_codon:yes stop_codon:yes gene_type:complete